MNIRVNIHRAIDNFGTVTLRTESTENGILVSIAETGSGSSKDSLTRIFDPFYTVKEVGEGIGFGLFISYSIM